MTRAIVLWGALRAILYFGIEDGLDLALRARLWMGVIVVAFTLFETRRQREPIFLEDLGVPARAIWLASVAPVLVGESVISIVLRVWTTV